MWRQQMIAVANASCSQGWLGEWKPTDITFRARSQAEAQKKADKFWRDAQFGSGAMLCIPADEDIKNYIAEGKDKCLK